MVVLLEALCGCKDTTMASCKVAVVTGSNKGIGLAIVRALCKQFDGDVYITSRDDGRGQVAVEELKKEGLSPKFHQLDVDDHASVQRLHDFLKEKYGGLDVLVNNAGIGFKKSSTVPFTEQVEITLKTNFWSMIDVCHVLFPLLRPHARVVNVSSFTSQLILAKLSAEKKARVLAVKTPADLKGLMTEFTEDVKADNHVKNGWPTSAYGMSKIGVTVLSMIQQNKLDSIGKDDIVVNAACPGFVKTDMTSEYKAEGKLTTDQGAENPVYAALLPANVKEPRGKFLREKTVAAWE